MSIVEHVPKVTVLKPIVHRGVECGWKFPVRYHIQWRKTTVGWLQRTTWEIRYRVRLKSMKPKRIIVVLKCKKCFFLRKLTKMSNLILCFPEFVNFFFVFACVRQVAFLSMDWKKLSIWSSGVLFTVSVLEMRERDVYRK